jgi:large subunit ribosomal protein L25
MEKIKLGVAKREAKTPKQLRREGNVPATLYGRGIPSESLQINAREFQRLPAAAYSHMIELQSPEGAVNAIIRQVARRSTQDFVYNVELYKVDLQRKVTVTVPLKFIGASEAVKAGAKLEENYQEANIECLPAEIPDYIEVDITALDVVEAAIHFGQVALPAGITILNPHDEIVVKVVAPKVVAPSAKEAAAAAAK